VHFNSPEVGEGEKVTGDRPDDHSVDFIPPGFEILGRGFAAVRPQAAPAVRGGDSAARRNRKAAGYGKSEHRERPNSEHRERLRGDP